MDKFAPLSSGLTLRGCVERELCELCERAACSPVPAVYEHACAAKIRIWPALDALDTSLTFGPLLDARRSTARSEGLGFWDEA